MLRRRAGSWVEKAEAEMEDLMGVEMSRVKKYRDRGVEYAQMESRGRSSNGESEWMVFKNDKDVEKYALDYVTEMLEDDPEMFSQNWLSNYIMVRPGDVNLIASEDADSYVEGLSDAEELLLEESKLEDDWLELQEKVWELEEEEEEEEDRAKAKKLRSQISDIERKMEGIVEDAREKVWDQAFEATKERLSDDLMEYLEDLGYNLRQGFPDWVTVDTDKAAKDALRMDGIAHFLDGYDGSEEYTDSGYVAFGTN